MVKLLHIENLTAGGGGVKSEPGYGTLLSVLFVSLFHLNKILRYTSFQSYMIFLQSYGHLKPGVFVCKSVLL